MHALAYCAREAGASLWRQRGSTLLSACTTGVAVLVVGVFLTLSFNLGRAVDAWSAAAEMTIYLRDDITQAQRVELNAALAGSLLVESRTYVSKADALARFRRDFPELAGDLGTSDVNPLPASIDVRLAPGRATADETESLAARLRLQAGVADVRYDRQWLARLAQLMTAIRWAGWIAGAILVAAAALTIATIVRLSLHARRDEVEIMQLMGAPVALLRGPLIVEGLFHGAAGALIAVAALYAGHAVLRGRVAAVMPGVVEAGWFAYLPWFAAAGLIAGGMAVGCVGGIVAARHVR